MNLRTKKSLSSVVLIYFDYIKGLLLKDGYLALMIKDFLTDDKTFEERWGLKDEIFYKLIDNKTCSINEFLAYLDNKKNQEVFEVKLILNEEEKFRIDLDH